MIITAEYILKLLDAGGPEAFKHMNFKDHHWTEFEYKALALVNDIYAHLDTLENLEASIEFTRQSLKEDNSL